MFYCNKRQLNWAVAFYL
uniref:Uncharacterized protein n=1 Tax=Rhizophora mucronata TaxID=61149 RepID=A0A2P2QF80_RHIMU